MIVTVLVHYNLPYPVDTDDPDEAIRIATEQAKREHPAAVLVEAVEVKP